MCREDNVNIYEINRIANKHSGFNILQSGLGTEGHCVSVSPWFLVEGYLDFPTPILTAHKFDDSMPKHELLRIEDILREDDSEDIPKWVYTD